MTTVAVIATGGTITAVNTGGTYDVDRHGAPAAVAHLVAASGLAVATTIIPFWELSENVTPEHWLTLADTIRSAQQGADGIIVLHGTDTLHWTAAALNFLLATHPDQLRVPVVLTGANIPHGEPGSDATTNFSGAYHAATALPAGVYIAFAGTPTGPATIYPATHTIKATTTGPDTFTTNLPPVATIDPHQKPIINGYWEPRLSAFSAPAHQHMATPAINRVAHIVITPTTNWLAAKAHLKATRPDALLLQTFPTGAVPTAAAHLAHWAVTNNIPVVATGPHPPENPDKVATYATTQQLVDAGATLTLALHPHVAHTKLTILPVAHHITPTNFEYLTPENT